MEAHLVPEVVVIPERVAEVYDRLVDETENPNTIHHRMKNEKLRVGLAIMEYMLGNHDENPLDLHF